MSAIVKKTKKRRKLIQTGGEDRVWTPPAMALQIVEHFQPSGRILDPCRGPGAFYSVMPGADWCEISEGRDFLQMPADVILYDWIVSNPPWSKWRAFTNHAMKIAHNVLWLCSVNAYHFTAREREIREAGFGLVEVLYLKQPAGKLFPNWPQSGISLGACWLRRGWTGSTYHNKKFL